MAIEVAYSFLSAAHALGGPSDDPQTDAVRPLRDIVVICDTGAEGAARIGATTTEIPGGRTILQSQPKAIADVTDRAAHGARGGAFKQ